MGGNIINGLPAGDYDSLVKKARTQVLNSSKNNRAMSSFAKGGNGYDNFGQYSKGGILGTIGSGDFTMDDSRIALNEGVQLNAAQRAAVNDYNSQFDTDYLGMAKTGASVIGALGGAFGAYSAYKHNKKLGQQIDQNMNHARQARADRTNFISGTQSAFA